MLDTSDMVLVSDSESIGLLPDLQVMSRKDNHIIVLRDYFTDEVYCFYDDFEDRINAVWLDDLEYEKAGTIADGIEALNNCAVLIMHNSTGYDYLSFEKTLGVLWKRNYFQEAPEKYRNIFPFANMDTLVMSRTLNPERKLPGQAYAMGLGNIGPHSIEAFGIAMGRYKPDIQDWTHLYPEMIHRCKEDTAIGKYTYDVLWKEWEDHMAMPSKVTGLSIKDAYMQEFRMALSMAYQAQRGFRVDMKYALDLCAELDEQIDATEKAFRPHMPQRVKRKKIKEDDVAKQLSLLTVLIAEIQGCSLHDAKLQANDWENQMWESDFKSSAFATYYNLTTAKGDYVKNVRKYIPEAVGKMRDYEKPPVAGPFTPYVLEDIPLGNRDEVKQVLYEHGWLGINFNETEEAYIEEYGEPPHLWSGKIDEDSIESWEKRDGRIPEWCKGIAKWYILNSRRNQLLNPKDTAYYEVNKQWKSNNGEKKCRGILPTARLYESGSKYGGITAQQYFEDNGEWPVTGEWRVPAIAFHAATNTFRMRHKVVVNIPTRGLYGHEMRRCFIAGEGKMLLGCDGAGLELRMLAHFMNDNEYIKQVLEGDIHTYNQQKAGLKGTSTMSPRDAAKKFIYMWLYGAGIPHLAKTLGISDDEMASCVEEFKRSLPGLKALLEGVQKAAETRGFVLSLDGRRGRIRTKGGNLAVHTALNTLLQMTGSLIMKYGHKIAEDDALSQGIIKDVSEFPIVAHQHDEGQMEVDKNEVEEVTYSIPKEDWKSEEKRIYIDDKSRMWSAPKKKEVLEDTITVIRRYHPLGECYAKAITKAGELFNLRIQTDGEYLLGGSWADTH